MIFFTVMNNGNKGHGRTAVSIDDPIDHELTLEKIEKRLQEHHKVESLIISNFQLLRIEEVPEPTNNVIEPIL